MNKPIFYMIMGLPCSGKSTFAQKLAEEYNANIHSSDAIREELIGDINNQEHNNEVFHTLHKRIKDDLRNGRSCIYDACNISYKQRMAFLNELKNIPCEKQCMLMATPYEWCVERNTKRERKVPEYVIKRMYMSFDVPWLYEGWGDIDVEYAPDSNGIYGMPRDWIEKVKNFNQDNSHHKLTLGEHCLQATRWFNKYADENHETYHTYMSQYAVMLHDCGKPFCKTFTNSKGEVTEQAHYYNHEHTGSYDYLFYDCNPNLRDATIVRWHMQPWFWGKDNNEKLHKKYKTLWGNDLYNDIMTLHISDIAAH